MKKLRFVASLMVILTAMFCFMTCSKPAAAPKPAKVTVICVGGLGGDQTTSIAKAVGSSCVDVQVITAASWDAYKEDIPAMAAKYKSDKLVLIGHSFGGEAIVKACSSIPFVDYLVLVDPVTTSWGDLTMPVNIGKHDYFWRTDGFGPRVARIPGYTATSVKGGHNSIPHDAWLIARITDEINKL